MLCRYERTIFKSDKGFCIFAYSTSDESVPKEARNRSYYHDDKIHFTAIGYHLIATDAVEVELDGTWENSKHGLQLSVSMCKEVVPRDQAAVAAKTWLGLPLWQADPEDTQIPLSLNSRTSISLG